MLGTRGRAASPIPVMRFALLGELPHGISTRHGGVSEGPYATLNMGLSTGDREENVVTNRRRFLLSHGVSPDDVVVGRFSHGNVVSVFRSSETGRRVRDRAPMGSGSSRREPVFRSDAVVSDVPGLHFLLTFADCVPLAFWHCKGEVMGAAHAGWRGTAQGIGPAVVRSMRESFGIESADLVVGIGPSIGPCCYSVQPEVVETFRANGFHPVIEERRGVSYLDLWSTNEAQLRRAGIPAESIESCRICTGCNLGTFYSHRVEQGRTGRFALVIGRR